jgi:DNA topoisomerase-3
MELKMKAICEGRKTRREVIEETVEQYRAVYVRTQQRLDVLRAVGWSVRCCDWRC